MGIAEVSHRCRKQSWIQPSWVIQCIVSFCTVTLKCNNTRIKKKSTLLSEGTLTPIWNSLLLFVYFPAVSTGFLMHIGLELFGIHRNLSSISFGTCVLQQTLKLHFTLRYLIIPTMNPHQVQAKECVQFKYCFLFKSMAWCLTCLGKQPSIHIMLYNQGEVRLSEGESRGIPAMF